jgi:hypothetical protein
MRLVPARPEPPAVRLHDGAADRQADADAVGLGRVERIEHLARTPCGVQTGAGIADLDEHRIRAAARAEAIVRRRGAILDGAHRLDRVHDQVEQHLLQLHPVAPDARQRPVELCSERRRRACATRAP